MSIKIRPQINIQIENKSQLVIKRVAVRDIEKFESSIQYGATLLKVDYNKEVETIDLTFAVNLNRKDIRNLSFIILKEGDFFPLGDWKMIKTLTSNFTAEKRFLFLSM